MEEILATTNSTNSALVAMKLSLVSIVIEELADVAIVFPHVDTAVGTKLSNLLLGVAD